MEEENSKPKFRAGSSDEWIELGRDGADGDHLFTIAASYTYGGCSFNAGRGMLSCRSRVQEALTRFDNHESNLLRIEFADDCSVELHRDARGGIDARFQIADWGAGPAWLLRGTARIEGEWANHHVSQLKSLFSLFPLR